MPDLREQIQSLIANNQTEDALKLLAQANSDALLLQAQYNSGKKNFNLGLIEFSEWQRIQARVNYGALDMAGRVTISPNNGVGNGQTAASAEVPKEAAKEQPKVFISYNQNDSMSMRAVKGALEAAGIKVFADIYEIEAGENIQAFIDKALQENTFILSLISRNSLVSGWVNIEINSAMLLNKFGKKWLPAGLDDACFDSEFYFSTLESFDEKIGKLRFNVTRAINQQVDSRPFEKELARQIDTKADFGKVIAMLKETLVVDISDKMFDLGIAKIISTIKK